jgi:hypothetical protein
MQAKPLLFVSVLTALLVLPVLPASAEEEEEVRQPDRWIWEDEGPRRLDVSVSAGVHFSSGWSDLVLLGSLGPVSGVLQQVLVRDLAVTPGPMLDATVTYWHGRLGFRVHGGVSSSCLAVGTTCPEMPLSVGPNDGTVLPLGSVDLRSWIFDVGGAFGLREYSPGQWVRPYGFFGLGVVTYQMDEPLQPPLFTFIERPGVLPEGPDRIVLVTDDASRFLLSLQELGLEHSFALNFGLGSDFHIPIGTGGVGLRLEVSNHIVRSPLRVRLVQLDGPARFGARLPEARLDFGPVHNLRFVAGVVIGIGLPDRVGP